MPASRTKHADPQAFSVSRADMVISLPIKEPDAIAAVPAYAISPNLRACWFNTYRRLFSIVCTANLVLMLLAATGVFHSGAPGSNRPLFSIHAWPLTTTDSSDQRFAGHTHAIAWAVGNVLVSVMFRNELFLWSLVYAPLVHGCRILNAPLWIKHRCTTAACSTGGSLTCFQGGGEMGACFALSTPDKLSSP